MKIEKISINQLNVDNKNTKTHGKKSIDSLKKSILEFQQYMPIVVNRRNYKILVGNGTYQALKQLNYEFVKVVFVDLNEQNENKLSILDNRTSQLSQIDDKIVEQFFYQLDEQLIKITGYSKNEIYEIMNNVSQQILEDQTQKINLQKIICPYCKAQFNL